jgi:lipoprotein-anchoring transpeptidase ErfK/SrfK
MHLLAAGLVALLAQQPAPTSPPAAAEPTVRQPEATAAAPDALQLQVMLDRAGFSPGIIDGRMGANTRKALEQYRRHAGRDEEAGADLPPTTTYTITTADAAGPFVERIPADLVEQGALPALGYTSLAEALAERFHTTPGFLQRLNPAARFAEGEQIQVPNVEPLIAPVEKPEMSPEARAAQKKLAAAKPTGTSGGGAAPEQPNTIVQRPDVVVTVSKSRSALSVTDTAGRVIFFAPVTTGSENDPLPIGEWTVRGLQFNPVFNYNPDLFWDADPSHSKTRLPSGPNNPVGLVWIDLDKEHYGIHGTPEPAAIGRSQSHGCVRLTNWDALRLAGMVKPGTKVVFAE